MNKSMEKKLLSYFVPNVVPTNAATYVTNVARMPDDKEIHKYLSSVLLPNYKCICKLIDMAFERVGNDASITIQ